MINNKPLNCYKTMEEYGQFIIRRFITPHFLKGSNEVYVLFDNPGQMEDNLKRFEQTRRDASLSLSTDHLCWVFFDEAEIPSKCNENLKCRTCKCRLTQFLSSLFTQKIKEHLKGDQNFVIAGANGQEVVVITRMAAGPYVSTELTSNAEETDTHIWLHVVNIRTHLYFVARYRHVSYWPITTTPRKGCSNPSKLARSQRTESVAFTQVGRCSKTRPRNDAHSSDH